MAEIIYEFPDPLAGWCWAQWRGRSIEKLSNGRVHYSLVCLRVRSISHSASLFSYAVLKKLICIVGAKGQPQFVVCNLRLCGIIVFIRLR